MSINLTDAEQRFADSLAGKAQIAYERNRFEMGQAHKGEHAAKWTDAMEANVIRQLAMDQARSNVAGAAAIAELERQLPAMKAAADTAYQQHVAYLNTAYRGGR